MVRQVDEYPPLTVGTISGRLQKNQAALFDLSPDLPIGIGIGVDIHIGAT